MGDAIRDKATRSLTKTGDGATKNFQWPDRDNEKALMGKLTTSQIDLLVTRLEESELWTEVVTTTSDLPLPMRPAVAFKFGELASALGGHVDVKYNGLRIVKKCDAAELAKRAIAKELYQAYVEGNATE